MLRHIILTVMFCLLFGFLAAQVDSLYLPQFANPFYDTFSRNYNGTTAAGRGYTGVAILGGMDNALLNPASVLPGLGTILVEMNVKPSMEADGYPMYANYVSKVPIGMLAINATIASKFSAGLLYSNPKSITLEDFSFYTNQGQNMIQRFPTYNLHQATAMVAYHRGPLHLGLNLHNQIHYIDDPIFLRSYDRVKEFAYNLRVQPGLIYEFSNMNMGLTMMPSSKFDWDLKYASYEAVLPLWIAGGVQFATAKYGIAAEGEWEQTSDICDSFEDRYTFKAGLEKYSGDLAYRLGYHFSSNVYSGMIPLAVNYANPDTSNAWDSVPELIYIKDNAKHSITAGISYYSKYGSLNLALMQVVAGDIKKTQVNISLGFYLKKIIHKRNPL